MQEVKFNYQNIAVEFTAEDKFKVINKNLFINTDEYKAYVILLADGEEVRRVAIEMEVAPLSEKEFKLPAALADYMKKVKEPEYVVIVSFVLKHDCLWAEAGYEVAFGQKVYRKAVKDHVETKGCLVIEGAIPESSLPGVYPGGKEILGRNIRIAERSNELIQQITFFEHAHGTDLFDDSFSAPKIDAEEEKKEQK